jgi:outer membrane protein insertion porin family
MRFLFKSILAVVLPLSAAFAETLNVLEVSPESETTFVESTIPVKLGEAWIPEYLRLSEKFLEATARYERVEVQWVESEGRLVIEVLPRLFFEGVSWEGETPKAQSRIQSLCVRRQEERQLTQSRLNEMSSCILTQLRGMGFLDSHVLVFGRDEILVIETRLGDSYRISAVEIEGAGGLRKPLLQVRLRNQNSKTFLPFLIQEDTERIQSFYRDRGYFMAQVYQPTIKVIPERKEVELKWEVEEGLRYSIDIENSYKGYGLVERVVSSGDSLPEWFLDEIQEEILLDYQSEGFLDVEVSRKERLRGKRQVEVTYSVNRGRQYRLLRPEWVGINNLEEIEKIYSKIPGIKAGSRFYETEYRRVFEESFFPELARSGYLDVKVRAVEFSIDHSVGEVRPILYMSEGDPYRVGSVEFLGVPEKYLRSAHVRRLKDAMSPTKVFNPILVDQYQQELREFLRNQGFLDLEISRSREEREDGTHDFVFQIEAGPQYRIRHVIVSGLQKTDIEVIRRELIVEPGEFYRLVDVDDTISQILRLGIARSVDIRIFEKNEKTGDLILMVSVDEAARFRFEVGPGFGTIEGVRGVFRATYANIGGTGRRLNFSSRASRKLESERFPDPALVLDPQTIPFIERRVSLEYFEPSIFSSPVDGRVVISHAKESRRQFGSLSNSITGSLDWRMTRNISLIPEYRIEYSNPFNVEIADGVIASDPAANRLHSLRTLFRFSFLDDNFSPVKGYRGNLSGEFFDSRIGGDLNFAIFDMTHEIFYPLYRPLYRRPIGFALSVNSGFANAYRDTPEVPVEKRFRLGGERTVRGFAEDAILLEDRNGGRSRFFFRSEVHLPITGSLDLLGFFDGGNVFASNSDFNPIDLRYGTGFGIRINTPVGPLKFGYAFVVAPQPDESRGRIYFDVGAI